MPAVLQMTLNELETASLGLGDKSGFAEESAVLGDLLAAIDLDLEGQRREGWCVLEVC